MLDTFTPSYRVIRRECVALFRLYGGEKDQRRDYIQVPPGTVGFVTHEVLDEDGITYLIVKFRIGTRIIHVRCAPSMVELGPVTVDSANEPGTGQEDTQGS